MPSIALCATVIARDDGAHLRAAREVHAGLRVIGWRRFWSGSPTTRPTWPRRSSSWFARTTCATGSGNSPELRQSRSLVSGSDCGPGRWRRVTRSGVDGITQKVALAARKGNLDARVRLLPARVTHRQRLRLALEAGGGAGEVQFHGLWAAIPVRASQFGLGERAPSEPLELLPRGQSLSDELRNHLVRRAPERPRHRLDRRLQSRRR